MSYAIVGGCVAPAKLVPFLKAIQADSHCTYNSIYRGADAAAELHKLGKHTQQELYDGFIEGKPGFLPANRPGTSTHELRSDGVAYAGPVGRKLLWWQCGFDVNDSEVPSVIAAAAKHGWVAFQPYHSGSEYHHINLVKQPRSPFLPLRPGSRNALYVWILRARLRTCGYRMADGKGKLLPKGHKFDSTTELVVRRFQKQHHLKADGVVGPQTWATLKKRAQANKRSK